MCVCVCVLPFHFQRRTSRSPRSPATPPEPVKQLTLNTDPETDAQTQIHMQAGTCRPKPRYTCRQTPVDPNPDTHAGRHLGGGSTSGIAEE